MRRTATTTFAAGAALTAATIGGATALACWSPSGTVSANSRTASDEDTATAAREESPEPEATFSAQSSQGNVSVQPIAVKPAAPAPAAKSSDKSSDKKSDPDDTRAHKAKVHASSERPSGDRNHEGEADND